MLSVGLPVDRLLVVRFLGNQKLNMNFQLCRGPYSLRCSSVNCDVILLNGPELGPAAMV